MIFRISRAKHLELPGIQILFERDWFWCPRNPYWTRTHHLGWVTVIFGGYRWRKQEPQGKDNQK